VVLKLFLVWVIKKVWYFVIGNDQIMTGRDVAWRVQPLSMEIFFNYLEFFEKGNPKLPPPPKDPPWNIIQFFLKKNHNFQLLCLNLF